MKKKWSWLLVALLAFGLLAAGCGGQEAAENGGSGAEQGGEAAETGAAKIIVGSDVAYAPFEYEGDDGKPEGFDVDLIKAIGKEVGLEMEVQHVGWDGLFPALEAGTIDCLISAMTIRDDREEIVDFSEPYFEAWQTIAVREGSDITDFQSLAGKKVGVQLNTTGHFAVQEIIAEEKIEKFETTPDALMNLTTGVLDAVVADRPVVQNYLAYNPDAGLLMVDDDGFEKEYYGIAVWDGNSELLAKINEGLAAVKANGTYDQIFAKYFGE